jgi:hypothetical protein
MTINFILQFSYLYQTLTGFTGTMLGLVYLCGYVYSNTANDCMFLMFHLSYYSIACYIRLLRAKLTSDNKLDSPWKGSKVVLMHLYEAFVALESLFSIPVLYIITSKLIIVALNLFAIIYGLVKPSSTFVSSWMIEMSILVITSLVHLLIVLDASDMPVYEVRSHL